MRRELIRLHWRNPITVLVHGNVGGIRSAAEIWARRNGVAIVRYPSNWEFFGKKAEGLRNVFMLEDSHPDLVLAFPGGRHTADLVRRAVDAKISVVEIKADNAADGAVNVNEMLASASDEDAVSLANINRMTREVGATATAS